MNKQGLVEKVAEKAEITKKDASIIVDTVFESVTEGLVEDQEVKIMGFGNFTVKERAARTARNPKTGEEIDIPAKNVARFKPGKLLKEAVE